MSASTDPIRLRALRSEDLPSVYGWHQDQDTVRTLGSAFRYRSETEAMEYMRRWLVSSDTQVRLAIERCSDNRLVGMTSLLDIDQINGCATLHLLFGEAAARGQGYGVPATRALLQHAFGDLGLKRVSLEVLAGNLPARRVYERSGFRVEGELRSAIFKDGARHNVIIMGILADEYFGAPAAD